MQRTEIFGRVMKIVTPFAKNAEALAKVTEESKIQQDLGVNSARLVDIILDFEEEFSIEVDDEAADSVRTIGNAIDVILAKSAPRTT